VSIRREPGLNEVPKRIFMIWSALGSNYDAEVPGCISIPWAWRCVPDTHYEMGCDVCPNLVLGLQMLGWWWKADTAQHMEEQFESFVTVL
jgi:hypothetical protein